MNALRVVTRRLSQSLSRRRSRRLWQCLTISLLAVLGGPSLAAQASPGQRQQGPQQPPPTYPQPNPIQRYQTSDGELPATAGGLYPTSERYYSSPPEASSALDRRGFSFQVGLGTGGAFAEQQGHFGVGYSLSLGGVLKPNLLALFDCSALTFGRGDMGDRATNAVFAGALQLFVTDKLWLKGGAGLAQLTSNNAWGFSLDGSDGLAGIAGLGIEVYRIQPDLALDLQFRVAGAHYKADGWLVNGAVMIGLAGY